MNVVDVFKMDQIVIKSEGNEEILLFYVDENGTEQHVVTTVENVVEQHDIQETSEEIAVQHIDNITGITETIEDEEAASILYECQYGTKDRWTEEETKQLLTFYIDNKETFVKGSMKKKFIWAVASKTSLGGKNPTACETKLRYIKKKYVNFKLQQQKGNLTHNWPYFDLCEQAFYDDPFVLASLTVADAPDASQQETHVISVTQVQQQSPVPQQSKDNIGIIVTKKLENNRTSSDDKVLNMLQLYLKYKSKMKNVPKELWHKFLWETITSELGEEDPEYWRKRFLNFKQHYIRLLDKKQNGLDIHWPYVHFFDEIYKDDEEFQRKYAISDKPKAQVTHNKEKQPAVSKGEANWDDTEMTVLVKYYYDCFHEFQDPSIPDVFLWSEVGRLLDRSPESCRAKYKAMKKSHLDNYNDGSYDVHRRVPLAILYDNIISREVELQLQKESTKNPERGVWKTEEIDELVQFLYDNIDMVNDPICYYVCFARLSIKLNRTMHACKTQWDALRSLYKTILTDKKENPDMEIDWRYIELFDRIFDYGMNEALLEGPENTKSTEKPGTLNVKKVNIKLEEEVKSDELDKSDSEIETNVTDDEEEDDDDDDNLLKERYGFQRRGGVAKAFKILQYYWKNKDMFEMSGSSKRQKSVMWEALARKINITAAQCAHRFRNLKQVYLLYLQREIKSPEKPIVWPYYQLCKKVFGYRAMKAKILRKNDMDYEFREWSAKELKALITYYGQNYNNVNKNHKQTQTWTQLAKQLGKSETACKDKFMDLRKSYRQLKTMLTRNPQTKVSWKYFNMFDEICSQPEEMEIEYADESFEGQKEVQEDDDIQCIFVIQEGVDIEDAIRNAQYVQTSVKRDTNATEGEQPTLTKWTKQTKKRLLLLYLNYIKTHKESIDASEMWKEIAGKLPNKTALSCRKMFAKMKKNRLNIDNIEDVKKKTPYYAILEKILTMKPIFAKKSTNPDGSLKKGTRFTDVPMLKEKVVAALEYYFDHLEEFLSPRYERKIVWKELADKVEEPMMKVYNKVMFLKNLFNKKDESINDEVQFIDILRSISEKQNELEERVALDRQISKEIKDTNNESYDCEWDDIEIEQLLIWYLANLEKFKSRKYVKTFLWKEASNILGKPPQSCSKKIAEIRAEYKAKVLDKPDELPGWRLLDLCQKIYGTGVKADVA